MPPQDNTPADALGQVMSLQGAGASQLGIESAPYISGIMVECQNGSLPFPQAMASDAIRFLKERMNLSPTSELSQFLTRIDLSDYSLKQVDNLVPIPLGFEDGSIEVERGGKMDVIQVSYAQMAEPASLTISVYGNSDDAEFALGRLYECLCASGGLNRNWADGRRAVGFKQHTTTSLETLNCGLDTLLSSNLSSAFKDSFKNHKTLLAQVGSLPIDPETDQPFPKTYIGSIKLSSLRITITRIDPESGSNDTSVLSISPHTKVDAGVGTYAVHSALPYTEHNKFVAALREALGGTTK